MLIWTTGGTPVAERYQQGPGAGPLPGLSLTRELEDQFLAHLRQSGYHEETVASYQRSLERLRRALPEGRRLDEEALSAWRDRLLARGYAPSTVNVSLAAANSLLQFAGRRDLQQPAVQREGHAQPDLTRREYLRLLQTARALDKRRTYLLVKLFALMDLPLNALAQVTAEAVQAGWVPVPDGRLRIPPLLQEELLDFLADSGPISGPVFRSRTGQVLSRGSVNSMIQALARDARVPAEKCNPRCLRKLYQETQADIRGGIERLVQETYDRLLETEQLAVAWREPSGLSIL